MSESNTTKQTKCSVFDDWKEVVDCNDCVRYWDSTCDAVNKGSKRACNSFLATRSITIPQEIKSLRSQINRLKIEVCIIAVLFAAYILVHAWGG